MPEFYGVTLQEYNEMGVGKKWNSTFGAGGSVSFDDHYSVGASATTFVPGSEEILVGIDMSRESLIRAVATDSESGDEFTLVADDQFVTRQSKIGYYGSLEEGRMIIDDRVLMGLIV